MQGITASQQEFNIRRKQNELLTREAIVVMKPPYEEKLGTQRKEYAAPNSYAIKQRLQTGHPCTRTGPQN